MARIRHDNDRLSGRNGDIWKAYARGQTQEAIAAKHGISQERVSEILSNVRASLPAEDRAHLVMRETEFLEQIRRELLAVADLPPMPAYSQGRPIVGDDGRVAEDHSQRLAAYDRAIKAHERLSKLLGLDAASKVEATVTTQERDATAAAAASALAFLDGADPEPS